MDEPTWQILICHMPSRSSQLGALRAELDRQGFPMGNVLVNADPALRFPHKRQRLQEAASADYICTIDDDDWIAATYVNDITAALCGRPDYISFWERYTIDGVEPPPLAKQRPLSCRDLSPRHVFRRDLAMKADWTAVHCPECDTRMQELDILGTYNCLACYRRAETADYYADSRWLLQIARLGELHGTFIPSELYHYQYRTADDAVWAGTVGL